MPFISPDSPSDCALCGGTVEDGSNFYRANDGKVTHAKCLYVKEGYDAAVADMVAWFKALFPACHGIIHRIQGGETKGFRSRATTKGVTQKVGHA